MEFSRFHQSLKPSIISEIKNVLTEPMTVEEIRARLPKQYSVQQVGRHLSHMCWDLGILLTSKGSKKYWKNPNHKALAPCGFVSPTGQKLTPQAHSPVNHESEK